MQKETTLKFTVIGLILLSLFFGSPVEAQKFRKKPKQISEKEQVQAEYFFVEGEKYFMLNDFSKANTFFQKSLSINPNNSATHFKLAETYFKTGDIDKALKHSNVALSISPDNKYYYLLTADLYAKKSEFERAAGLYEQMIKKIDGTNEYLFELAELYLYQEDYKKALEVYDRAQEAFGINQNISFQKQKVYLKLNKVEEALEEGDALIKAFPSENTFVLRQAQILLSNNKAEEAVVYLNKLLAADPSDSYAHMLLAEVYSGQKKQNLAEKHLLIAFKSPELEIGPKLNMFNKYFEQLPDPHAKEMSLKLARSIEQAHPDNFNTYAVYGDLLLQLNRKEEAERKYMKALEIDGSNYNLWQNAISIEMELGQYEDVIKHSEEALELFPNQAALYYFNGSSNLIQKNYREAVRALEQGKRMASSNPDMMQVFNSQLGDAYNGLKEYKKSDQAYEEVLKTDAKNYHVLNNYSYFLSLRKDKLERALEMSKRLVEGNPDNPTFLDTHAWVLYTIGEYQEARQVMERALQGKVSSTILEHYGDILFKLGKTELAVEQWQKAKKLNEGSSKFLDKKIADKKLYE